MSLNTIFPDLKTNYNSAVDDIVADIYSPCLSHSNQYFRGTAYFRSSVLSLFSKEILEFCLRGGKIEILTSIELSEHDVESIKEGYFLREMEGLLTEILNDSQTEIPGRFLCTLIASGHLDIHIVTGNFYHDKVGFFACKNSEDSNEEMVAFIGSGNETRSGVSTGGNIERYTLSWSTRTDFSEYGAQWSDELRTAITSGKYLDGSIIERFDRLPSHIFDKFKINEKLEREWFNNDIDLMYFDYDKLSPNGPQPHQIHAFNGWKKNKQFGLFEHATGTYKTATGLICSDHFFKESDTVVISSPLRIVSENWYNLVKKCFPRNINVIKCWGDNPNWDTETMEAISFKQKTVLIFVNDSLWGERGDLSLRLLKNNYFLIADEAHNWQDSRAPNFMKNNAPKARLALTAKLSEPGEEDLMDDVLTYFAGSPPFVDKLDLDVAIKMGFLRNYSYSLVPVRFSESDDIALAGTAVEIWNAYNDMKKDMCVELGLSSLDKRNRVLIYTGPKITDASEIFKSMQINWNLKTDNVNLFRKVTGEENQSSRKKIISDFTNGITRSLVAIKVLDEGVDLPISDAAIMGRSNEKYRQWIQRRGRVLRKKSVHDDTDAIIYDFILDLNSINQRASDNFLTNKGKEIERVLEFARSSSSNSNVIESILISTGWKHE
jgi:superfamily II DNA or RNA helicase